jgi:hypothetical protein
VRAIAAAGREVVATDLFPLAEALAAISSMPMRRPEHMEVVS